MFSSRECQMARLMTGSDATDDQISQEYAAMLGSNRRVAALRLDEAVRRCGLPFEQAWERALKDFRELAAQYRVSPATLFCLYLEWADANGVRLQ